MAVKYNSMLFGTNLDFDAVLRRYSLCPPSHINNHRGTDLVTGTGGTREIRVGHGAADTVLAGSTRSANVRLAEIDPTRQIAYFDLDKWPKQTAATMFRGHEGGNTLYMNATYAATAGHQAAWYLPWDDAGAAVRTTIPSTANVVGTNPSIFITAAINGCSIFFQGTTQNPTIYHCGGPTGYASDKQNDAAEFWQAVVAETILSDAAHGVNKGMASADSVDKRDYVSAVGTGVTKGGSTTFSTPRANAIRQELKKRARFGKIDIEEVRPWGAVVGRRDPRGDWKFYLQENATITYHQFSNFFGKQTKGTHRTATIARPMAIKEIFPSGPQQVLLTPPLPKLV